MKSPLLDESATLHARCEKCDNHRMFNLGPVQTRDAYAKTWEYIDILSRTECGECGAIKWATSVRLGVITPIERRDVVVDLKTALALTPVYTH